MTHSCFTTLLLHNMFCFILICDALHNHFIFSIYKVLFTFCFMPVQVTYSLSPSSAPFLPCPVGSFTCLSTVFTILHHFSYLFFLVHTSKCVCYCFSYLFFLAHTSKCVYYCFSYLFFLAYTSKCVYYCFSYFFFLAHTSKCVYYCLFIRHENVLFPICLRKKKKEKKKKKNLFFFLLADLKMGLTSSLVVQVLNLV